MSNIHFVAMYHWNDEIIRFAFKNKILVIKLEQIKCILLFSTYIVEQISTLVYHNSKKW